MKITIDNGLSAKIWLPTKAKKHSGNHKLSPDFRTDDGMPTGTKVVLTAHFEGNKLVTNVR